MDPGNKIRVAQLCPGMVATEFPTVAGVPQMLDMMKEPLTSEDMADHIRYIIQAPPHVQIHDIMVRPTGQPM